MRYQRNTVMVTALYVVILTFVAAVHFGCEEEPTAPSNCGQGPFQRDAKSGTCKSLATGSVVDDRCCQ